MDLQRFVPGLGYGNYSEFFAEDSKGFHISFEDGKVDEIESGQSCGFALRYLDGDETRFGHADGSDPLLVQKLSKGLSQGLKNLEFNRDFARPEMLRHAVLKNPFEIALTEKVRLLEKLDRAARALDTSKNIRQITISYGEKLKRIYCLSQEKSNLSACAEERLYTVLAVTVTAEKDGILQSATEVSGALCGWELFDQQNPVEIAQNAARRAIQKLQAAAAPIGEMAVILQAEAGGTMIHEAIGHSLEADAVQKGISPVYAGKLGAVVASEKITVYDDPTVAGKRGSFIYDDEGTKSERTVLVERGVLKTYLYDRITAVKEGRKSNGHGRRESYAYRPIPRMSNTFIASGPDDPKEILCSVQNGLLVRRMGGGQVNPVTGDFVFEVEEGYKIENGKIGPMVRGASLLGNGPQVLKSIDLVGNDLGWGVGTCGKEGQGVPVSDAQPTIRVPKLLVGGQE